MTTSYRAAGLCAMTATADSTIAAATAKGCETRPMLFHGLGFERRQLANRVCVHQEVARRVAQFDRARVVLCRFNPMTVRAMGTREKHGSSGRLGRIVCELLGEFQRVCRLARH